MARIPGKGRVIGPPSTRNGARAINDLPRLQCTLRWLGDVTALPERGWAVLASGTRFERCSVEVRWTQDSDKLLWRPPDSRRVTPDGCWVGSVGVIFVCGGEHLETRAALGVGVLNDWVVSRDGRWLAGVHGVFDDGGEFRIGAGYFGCGMALFDLASGERVCRVDFDDFLPAQVEFTDDFRVVIVGSEGETTFSGPTNTTAVRVVHMADGAVEKNTLRPLAPTPRSTTLRPDTPTCPAPGKTASLEWARDQASLVVRDHAGVERGRRPVVPERGLAVAFSPDGRAVLARTASGCRLWDVDDGSLLASFPGGPAGFTSNGEVVTWTPREGSLLVRRWARDRLLDAQTVPGTLPSPYGADGGCMPVLQGQGVTLWDGERAQPLASFETKRVRACCRTTRAILSADGPGRVRLHTPEGSRLLTTGSDLDTTHLAFSGDGTTVFGVADQCTTVIAWDTERGEPRWRTPLGSRGPLRFRSVWWFCQDASRQLLYVGLDQDLVRIDARDGRAVARIHLGTDFPSAPFALSPNGARVASVHGDGTVCLHELGGPAIP